MSAPSASVRNMVPGSKGSGPSSVSTMRRPRSGGHGHDPFGPRLVILQRHVLADADLPGEVASAERHPVTVPGFAPPAKVYLPALDALPEIGRVDPAQVVAAEGGVLVRPPAAPDAGLTGHGRHRDDLAPGVERRRHLAAVPLGPKVTFGTFGRRSAHHASSFFLYEETGVDGLGLTVRFAAGLAVMVHPPKAVASTATRPRNRAVALSLPKATCRSKLLETELPNNPVQAGNCRSFFGTSHIMSPSFRSCDGLADGPPMDSKNGLSTATASFVPHRISVGAFHLKLRH